MRTRVTACARALDLTPTHSWLCMRRRNAQKSCLCGLVFAVQVKESRPVSRLRFNTVVWQADSSSTKTTRRSIQTGRRPTRERAIPLPTRHPFTRSTSLNGFLTSISISNRARSRSPRKWRRKCAKLNWSMKIRPDVDFEIQQTEIETEIARRAPIFTCLQTSASNVTSGVSWATSASNLPHNFAARCKCPLRLHRPALTSKRDTAERRETHIT